MTAVEERTTTREHTGAGEELAWISWLRVLAIAGVVTIHTAAATAVIEGARDQRRGLVAIILDIGAVFTVPVFVMVSGALLLDPRRFRGAGDFLRRRAWRLVPAILFWHVFYLGFRYWYKEETLTWDQVVNEFLNGRTYTALYFFWIVLGLALITPMLVPWIATASRRAVLVAGAGAAAMPILTMATLELRGTTVTWIVTPWTWWTPYLGFYLLGWALRGVVLRGFALAGVAVAAAGLGAMTIWQWNNPAAPDWLQTISPVTYYGLGVHLYSIAVFLLAQALIRPGALLGGLARPRMAGLGRLLGDATLGVFALHLAVLGVVVDERWIGNDVAAGSAAELLLRIAVVLVATYAIVLLARLVPVVRRVF
ncbi:acyltransferase [Jiangella alkaliphila]|uniref:Surface polysaccharide O-acyltransferase, integral membrane enzyme n=1 Tax=Jiangella alkaliphila TaxID=419479 RepID=A0A1H2M086_9ACTN|nr:acyltransferase [Jiangella alkaliphila]SDU86554.1 Surface polysaccharide O-acyltransferase, integral membrane enzyme [Jiangella alkaliphila]